MPHSSQVVQPTRRQFTIHGGKSSVRWSNFMEAKIQWSCLPCKNLWPFGRVIRIHEPYPVRTYTTAECMHFGLWRGHQILRNRPCHCDETPKSMILYLQPDNNDNDKDNHRKHSHNVSDSNSNTGGSSCQSENSIAQAYAVASWWTERRQLSSVQNHLWLPLLAASWSFGILCKAKMSGIPLKDWESNFIHKKWHKQKQVCCLIAAPCPSRHKVNKLSKPETPI